MFLFKVLFDQSVRVSKLKKKAEYSFFLFLPYRQESADSLPVKGQLKRHDTSAVITTGVMARMTLVSLLRGTPPRPALLSLSLSLSRSLISSSSHSARPRSPSRLQPTSAGRYGGGGGRRSSALRERESRGSAIVSTDNVLVQSPGCVAAPPRRMGRSSRTPRHVPVEAS